jgi:hypothetical protein
VDMNVTDLVGINGITRVLLVYTCQQGVYPRGHVPPLRLQNIAYHIREKLATEAEELNYMVLMKFNILTP